MSQSLISPVLVTGGAGYIGSMLVGRLLNQQRRVRVLDNFSFGGESLLGYLSNPNFDLVMGDICKPDIIDKALAGIKGIVHLAAIVGDPACRKHPQLATCVNKDASRMLHQKAVAVGVRRFVFVSTCSNYGKMSDDVDMVDEESPLKPVSLYAELKVGFENYLLSQVSSQLEPVVLRFATAYGLSPRPRFDLTVNEFTRDLVLNRPLEIYGEQFWRPYCHVVDLARACQLALSADSSDIVHQAFNVGDTKENYTKKDLIEIILKELPDRHNHVSFVRRDEDLRDYRVNCNKIKSTLGFAITRHVVDGVREIIHALQSGMITDPDNARYGNMGVS